MAVRLTTPSFSGNVETAGQPPTRVGPGLRQRAAKRAVDLLVGTLLLLLLSPLLLGVAIVLLVVSRRPVFFCQARVGWHGEIIRIFKFRTMVVGAEDLRDEAWSQGASKNTSPPPALFKLRDDPRVTRIGRVLRRFSIDELPQLWNVLRGEMSLVGPRPLPLSDHERAVGIPGIEERLVLRPGITGPWQVRGRSNLGVHDMIALDLEYIARWTLARDVGLLVATVPAVIRGRGAY